MRVKKSFYSAFGKKRLMIRLTGDSDTRTQGQE